MQDEHTTVNTYRGGFGRIAWDDHGEPEYKDTRDRVENLFSGFKENASHLHEARY